MIHICKIFYFDVSFANLQDSDKEEMKEILEMKRIHERLAKKRLAERELRARERQEICRKLISSAEDFYVKQIR